MLFQIGSSYNAAISEIILAKTVSQNYACPRANFEKIVRNYKYRGSPTYTKIKNTVITTTFFGLCTCKWGN